MKLEFNIYELNKECSVFKIISQYDNKIAGKNEFIIVSEEKVEGKDYFKTHQLQDEGLKLIGGLKLDKTAYSVEKKDMKLKGESWYTDSTELDIPKKYLTIDLVETIQRLNS